MSSVVLAAVLTPFAGLPGLGSAPEPPAQPPAPAALAAAAPDPWPELELRLLASVGEPPAGKPEEFKREVARQFRSDPSAELASAVGRALATVHRLSRRRAEAAAEILSEQTNGSSWTGTKPTKLFAVDGRLYASANSKLRRFAGDGWDEFSSLPAMHVRELKRVDGRLHAAGDAGLFALVEGTQHWEQLASFPVATFLRHDGLLYAGNTEGLRVLRNGKWTQDAFHLQAQVRQLASRDGKVLASTSRGLFQGESSDKELLKRRGWFWRLFGRKPAVVRAKGELAWENTPLVSGVVRVTSELDGRLAAGADDGVFISNPDGTWRHELEAGEVSRLLELPDGRALAISGRKLMVRGVRDWKEALGGYHHDAAALGDVVFAAGENGIQILLGLAKGWQETAMKALEAVVVDAPAQDPGKSLTSDDQSIRNRSGRSIFEKE